MTRDDTRDTTKDIDKAYDTVAAQRQIREQISHETEGMSFEELQRYLRSHITVPFMPLTRGGSAAA
jgi:hypothetical protein